MGDTVYERGTIQSLYDLSVPLKEITPRKRTPERSPFYFLLSLFDSRITFLALSKVVNTAADTRILRSAGLVPRRAAPEVRLLVLTTLLSAKKVHDDCVQKNIGQGCVVMRVSEESREVSRENIWESLELV
ncbi:MAG: hypothetical protein OM95_06520 [Bdellovibrio sp. ArHS]|nr:MAG: hypothetical protein OM95_06520 [Bdellovibrio sp. ArHS]